MGQYLDKGWENDRMAILAKTQKWYEGKSERWVATTNQPPLLLRERVKTGANKVSAWKFMNVMFVQSSRFALATMNVVLYNYMRLLLFLLAPVSALRFDEFKRKIGTAGSLYYFRRQRYSRTDSGIFLNANGS